jgi:DNA-binding transcriptional MerR regulator
MMRAAHRYPASNLLELLNAAHARLHAERRELQAAKEAVAAISAEPIADSRPSDSMSISELAEALGVRPSTLRDWDSEALVVPHRTSARTARTYSPSDVRDARIVHQLRMAGYGISSIQALMPQLRRAQRWDEVQTMLAAREASIASRSHALLQATAALTAVIDAGPAQDGNPTVCR